MSSVGSYDQENKLRFFAEYLQVKAMRCSTMQGYELNNKREAKDRDISMHNKKPGLMKVSMKLHFHTFLQNFQYIQYSDAKIVIPRYRTSVR